MRRTPTYRTRRAAPPPPRGTLPALALLAVAAAGSAFAQPQPPSTPSPPEAPSGPRVLITPGGPDSRSGTDGLADGTTARDDAIRVQGLDALGASAAGLSPAATGFRASIWDGAPPGLLLRLIEGLPAPIDEPAAHDLALRLLLSPIPTSGRGEAILLARLEALQRLGANEELTRLLDALPVDLRQAPRVAALAPVGGEDCGQAGAVAERLACLVVQGQSDEVALQLDLAAERTNGGAGEEAVLALARAWLNGEAVAGSGLIEEAPPAAWPMFAVLRVDEAAIDVDDVPAGAAAALSRNTDLPARLRLNLAERAATGGALAAGRLDGLYRELGDRVGDQGAGRRAQRLAAVRDADDPAARVEALIAAWAEVEEGAFRPAWGRVLQPYLAALDPDPALAPRLAPLVALHFAAGEPSKVTALERLVGDALTTGGASPVLLALSGDGRAVPAALEELQRRPGERELAMLGALGVELPATLLEAAAGTGGRASSTGLAAWLSLQEAAGDPASGTDALAALALLGPDPLEASPVTLATALKALADAGLEIEARRLALSLAIALGA